MIFKPHPKQLEFYNDKRERVLWTGPHIIGLSHILSRSEWIRYLFLEIKVAIKVTTIQISSMDKQGYIEEFRNFSPVQADVISDYVILQLGLRRTVNITLWDKDGNRV